HLRPNGRIQLLLGATLALTLLAALVALPSLSMQWFLAHNGLPATRRLTDPLDAFMVSWSVLAVDWICIFALSRSMLAMALLGFLPILVISLGKVLVPIIPGAIWVLLPGIACWMLFAAWYLRTKSVTRPEFPMSGDPSVG